MIGQTNDSGTESRMIRQMDKWTERQIKTKNDCIDRLDFNLIILVLVADVVIEAAKRHLISDRLSTKELKIGNLFQSDP